MKSINSVIMVLMVMAISACGGSGGGGGGGGGNPGPTGGSATFSGITHGAGGTQCVKGGTRVNSYADSYNNAISCGNAGGTWHDDVNSYPAIGDVCRVGSRDFNLRATGSANLAEETACVNAGGSVVYRNTETSSYCDISAISPAVTCSDIGGVEYSTDVLTGSFISSNISGGTNTISADPTEVLTALGNPFGGLDNVTVTPAVITAEVTISNYWDYTISMSYSVSNFQSAVSPSVKFTATSPMSVNGSFSFSSNSVKIYYRPF